MNIDNTTITHNKISFQGEQTKKGCRGLHCWSCGGFNHLQRDYKTGCDDDDDQPD